MILGSAFWLLVRDHRIDREAVRILATVCFATMIVAVLCVGRIDAQPLMDLRYPKPVRLSFHGKIDGSDRLIIDKTGIRWEHRHWQWPKAITLDDVQWNPLKTPKLEYSSVLSGAVDFSSARMSINEARDMAVLQRSDDRVVVDFADSPLGRGIYNVTIYFGD